MALVSAIIYRYLTNSDFYNMYKPTDSEVGGGGQTYIDFPTQDVPVASWEALFRGVAGVSRERGAQGPVWTVPLRSIGTRSGSQPVRIYQRRPQTVSIASQTLDRASANRVSAWHPRHGFPVPAEPANRHQLPHGLAVFLARTADDVLWAGWFLNDGRRVLPVSRSLQSALQQFLTVPSTNRHRAGIIAIGNPPIWLDETDADQPFKSPPAAPLPPAPNLPGTEAGPEYPISERARRVAERRSRATARATDAQGRQLDPARRKAVELYAMQRAMEAYPGAEDTSAIESFDLRLHQSGAEVRIEVKGTLGSGDYILVTANEVQNARGEHWRTDLFVVSEIQLQQTNGEYVATGGVVHTIRAWTPSRDDLTPTQFRYRVPR